jgi:hypothetical protein
VSNPAAPFLRAPSRRPAFLRNSASHSLKTVSGSACRISFGPAMLSPPTLERPSEESRHCGRSRFVQKTLPNRAGRSSGRVRPNGRRAPGATGGIKVVKDNVDFSHGGNTGSSPVGSAKDFKRLAQLLPAGSKMGPIYRWGRL